MQFHTARQNTLKHYLDISLKNRQFAIYATYATQPNTLTPSTLRHFFKISSISLMCSADVL